MNSQQIPTGYDSSDPFAEFVAFDSLSPAEKQAEIERILADPRNYQREPIYTPG